MKQYKERNIVFRETIQTNGWTIKIYVISLGDFNHPLFYENVKAQLPSWLSMENSFNADHDNHGFLILHEGREGIFSLINWWVGQNMLNTHVFLTEHDDPTTFSKISGDGLGPCMWENQIINHEGISWLNNTIKHKTTPDYQAYVEDVFNGKL